MIPKFASESRSIVLLVFYPISVFCFVLPTMILIFLSRWSTPFIVTLLLLKPPYFVLSMQGVCYAFGIVFSISIFFFVLMKDRGEPVSPSSEGSFFVDCIVGFSVSSAVFKPLSFFAVILTGLMNISSGHPLWCEGEWCWILLCCFLNVPNVSKNVSIFKNPFSMFSSVWILDILRTILPYGLWVLRVISKFAANHAT